jgi:hypothetical protein
MTLLGSISGNLFARSALPILRRNQRFARSLAMGKLSGATSLVVRRIGRPETGAARPPWPRVSIRASWEETSRPSIQNARMTKAAPSCIKSIAAPIASGML